MNEIIKPAQLSARFLSEIRQARQAFPGLALEAAYIEWKKSRGEKPELTFSYKAPGGPAVSGDMIRRMKQRPCTVPRCGGVQFLEPVCSGCVEGLAGYKSKWTCDKCMHRDLSKEGFMSWIQRLSSPSKPS